ncbi:MAG TPA: hypothetical protein VNJ04_06575 [Gemmatimonadaceae bacterium]|nr:hypothetical protein [Gemmatimonadaceae bacterium]
MARNLPLMIAYPSLTTAIRRALWIWLYGLCRFFRLERILLPEMGDMRRVGRIERAPDSPESSRQRVLFVSPRYWSTFTLFQIAVAQALIKRGADCAIVTCGGVQPICEIDWRAKSLVSMCRRCASSVLDLAKHAGIPASTVADNVDLERIRVAEVQIASADWAEIEKFEWNGVALGPAVFTAVRWKLRTHFPERHPLGRETALDFIRDGIRWTEGIGRILDKHKPDVVVMLNGVFLPEKITAQLASARGARVVFFETGRDRGTIFLSHEIPAPRYDVSASWSSSSEIPLSLEEDKAIGDLIGRRARGEDVVETYWSNGEAEKSPLKDVLDIPDVSRLAVLYTNVIWDTAMQDRDVVFENMFEWIGHTIRLFASRPDWTLVIRVHPAESQLKARLSYDRVADWIKEKFPEPPPNIRVVLPQQPVDSYDLMRLARIGLVYASTAGLELALHNVPVIVAGDAHYRGKGFTHDPVSPADFTGVVTGLLDGAPGMNDDFTTNAKRYAHLFFLRRTLPMAVVDIPTTDQPRLTYSSLSQLEDGQNETLDIICDGILTGSEFVL